MATPELIPLFDLRLLDEDLEAVAAALRSGRLAMGPRTEAFERAFAEHLGCEHAVAVSSCTAALHLAYLAAGVGPGDEVIVPSYTFAATAAAVLYCGATPVFADILGRHDPSIDPDHVASLVTERTRAVACVHFGGYAVAIDALRALCDERDLMLVEDCAHAPASIADGRMLGTVGDAGCFSFFSNKVLSVGEGGLLATDDAGIAEAARRGRSHTMTSGTGTPGDVVGFGLNYRLDEPRSALAHSRLGRLGADIARRRELTHRYRELLRSVDGLILPYTDAAVDESSCYIMPVMVTDPDRQGPVRLALREVHGVQTSLMYPSVHEFTAYRRRFPGVSLPQTERCARSEICIPLFPHMRQEQQDRVVAALRSELGAAS
jgi:dTDP-4-amino-4,6-dideoxygalactose transaminase